MAKGKIVNLWGISTSASYPYPLDEGMLMVSVSRKRQVFTLAADRLVDAVEYDEGTGWLHSISVPLTFLGELHTLQNFIESSLAGLDFDVDSLQEISLGIMSYIYGVVGRRVKKFYVIAYLEITAAEVVREEPDLRLLLQEYRARLHEAAISTPEEEPCGASRESIQKLKATSFIAREDANLGSCAICLGDLAHGEDEEIGSVIKMPCHHLFHHPCIVTWLERSPKCPLCRRELPC